MAAKPLGRRVPTDWEHVAKYPLTALAVSEYPKVPLALGINWYANFDKPQQNPVDSRHWIGCIPGKPGSPTKTLGKIRGGHCVAIKSGNYSDLVSWWKWYDQGDEGACVGFGCSRVMSLMNRKKYEPRWLWDIAKATDEWADTNPGDQNGTSVRAGLDVLRDRGHVIWKDIYQGLPYLQRDDLFPSQPDGIVAYRWATTVDEIRQVLHSTLNDQLQAVPILNSWGTFFPHITWVPYTVLQRLLDEDGECGIPTDR